MSKGKIGTNKEACKKYSVQARREKNKIKNLARDEKQKKRAAEKRAERIKAGKPVHNPTQKEKDQIFLRQQEILNNG